MRPICNNYQILLDCNNITLAFTQAGLLLALLKWFGQWCQIWGYARRSGVFNTFLGFSSEDLGFLAVAAARVF